MASSTRRDTVRQIKLIIYYVYYMPFSDILSDFKTCFGLSSRKIEGTFAITLRFLTSRQHVFRLWFHAFNLLYVTSPQKQVTDVSLVLKDSDMGLSCFLYQMARKQTVLKSYQL